MYEKIHNKETEDMTNDELFEEYDKVQGFIYNELRKQDRDTLFWLLDMERELGKRENQ